MMRAGRSPEEALSGLVAGDPGRDGRQVAFIDAAGNVSTHTGPGCIAEAGHVTGDHFSTQANMMERDTVWNAMAEAYVSAPGDLAERLLVALEAAEAEGGDIRGKQSAALLIVAGEPTGRPWDDRIYDLRVEDNPEPLPELRRLVRLRRSYIHMTEGDEAIGRGDMPEALRQYDEAERLVPEIVEMPFWKAVGLAGTGAVEESIPIFTAVFEREPAWRDLLPRVVDAGLLDLDETTLRRILS
jgi:uncharacterized Ntn-hydrolase superfamily protein